MNRFLLCGEERCHSQQNNNLTEMVQSGMVAIGAIPTRGWFQVEWWTVWFQPLCDAVMLWCCYVVSMPWCCVAALLCCSEDDVGSVEVHNW